MNRHSEIVTAGPMPIETYVDGDGPAMVTTTVIDGASHALFPEQPDAVASARSAYLRASTYYDMGLYFILGTTARARTPSRAATTP